MALFGEDDFKGIPGGGYTAAGGAALGTGADIWAFIQNQQRQAAIQKIYDILSNPRKLSDYVQKFYQPMSGAASAAAGRDLSADWAQRAGGATGGALNQHMADAFAKIETQRYQTAADQALRALTGASGAAGAGPTAQMGNLGGILKALMTLRGQTGQPKQPGLTTFSPQGGDPTGFNTAPNYYSGVSPDAFAPALPGQSVPASAVAGE